MRVLALDTATDRATAALVTDGVALERGGDARGSVGRRVITTPRDLPPAALVDLKGDRGRLPGAERDHAEPIEGRLPEPLQLKDGQLDGFVFAIDRPARAERVRRGRRGRRRQRRGEQHGTEAHGGAQPESTAVSVGARSSARHACSTSAAARASIACWLAASVG